MSRSDNSAKLEMRILRFMQLPFVIALLINMLLVVRLPLQQIRADAPPATSPQDFADPFEASEPQEEAPVSEQREFNPSQYVSSSDHSRELPKDDRAANGGTDGSRLDGALLLIHPTTDASDIHYVVDNEARVLRPGQSEHLGGRGSCTIQFHRGGDFGEAEYVLTAGTYEFTAGSQGWELVEVRTSESARK